MISPTLRQEHADFLRSLPKGIDDYGLATALGTRFCHTLLAKPYDVACELARFIEPDGTESQKLVLKLDIFEQPQTAVLSVSVKQLQELYELGVYRGSMDVVKPSQMKCVIDCGVISCGTADGVGEDGN